MSTQLDPLKTTAPDLHRFWFMISTERQWYDIMRECRSWFGKNWRGQSKVKKKLASQSNVNRVTFTKSAPMAVWFEVPDPRFGTWISIKLSMQVQSDAKFQAAK
jgi:hypothetical protein